MHRLTIALFVFLLLGGTARAAVIISACPSPNTDLTARSQIVPPSTEKVAPLTPSTLNRVLSWIDSEDTRLTQQRIDIGRQRLHDVALYVKMQWPYHECASKPYAIFPYVAAIPAGGTIADLRAGYKICQFYQDDKRQIAIEGTCRPIGRSSGYSLAALDRRYDEFNDAVRGARKIIDITVIAGGALGSGKVLKVVRTSTFFAATGALSKSLIIAMPLMLASGLAYFDVTNLPILNETELRDAARLVSQGMLADVVKVSMPIEDFESEFASYLESIPDESIPKELSAVDTAKNFKPAP
jgi:hypothetical protein